MAIADLYDVVLLKDPFVEEKFLLLELLQQGASDVNGHDVQELDLDLSLGIVLLDLRAHASDVAGVLEERGHGFLAGIDALDVLLG